MPRWYILFLRTVDWNDEKSLLSRRYECRCAANDAQTFSQFIDVTLEWAPMSSRNTRQYVSTTVEELSSAVVHTGETVES